MTLFDNADYTAAQEAFAALGDYKDSAHMSARCPIQPEYDAAMQLYYDGKYAEATWAFEALGDYEDSAEKKKTAELSWRKSLANLISDDGYNSYVSTYFVTPNGTVSDFKTGTETVKIGEHGKVISITNGYGGLLVLYEDGTAIHENRPPDNRLDDVIQIIPTHWIVGDIALMSDGSVYVEGLKNEENAITYKKVVDSFAKVSEWKDIVMLSVGVNSFGNADFSMTLTGMDVDGNVYICYSGLVSAYLREVSGEIHDVKHVDAGDNVYMLKNDGTVMVLNNNDEILFGDDSGIVDICANYTLSSDGKLRELGLNKAILNDVVEIFSESLITGSGYAITRSGAIYRLDGEEIGFKTVVYDEWLSRME